MLTRRQLLGGAALALAMSRAKLARAIGPASKFRFGQLQLGPAWNPRPTALKRLGWEIEKRTSIDVDLDPAVVTPTSDTLHETPFLYLAGEKAVELPSTAGIEALRRFLTFGGFLLIDNAEGSMSKYKASEVAVRVTEEAIQILGGYGYTREYPVERWHRDAKIHTIFEGTSEIQQLVIARAISGLRIE